MAGAVEAAAKGEASDKEGAAASEDGGAAKKEEGLEHSMIADREQIDRTYSAAAAAVDSDFAGMT